MGLALIESIGTIVSLVAVVLSVASLTFRTRQNGWVRSRPGPPPTPT